MDNLLNFKQIIVKRSRKDNQGKSLVWTYKPVNGLIKHKKRVFCLKTGKTEKRNRHHQINIIWPKQILRHFKTGIEQNRRIKTQKKRVFRLKLKYIITGFAVFFLLSGAAAISTLYSSAKTFDTLTIGKDSIIDNLMKESFIPENEKNTNSDEIDLSILKGLKTTQYKVTAGDSLSSIAQKHNVTMGTIISFNNIKNARRIYKGTVLNIPRSDGLLYQVKRGDSLSGIASKYNISLNKLLDINNIETAVINPGDSLFIPDAAINSYDLKKALGELFLFPVKGRITSGFGYRSDPFTGKQRMHYGIDIANKIGTNVDATLDGKVLKCGLSPVYGKFIIIKHPGGYQSLYAHLNKIRVREGENVSQGQVVGELGNTGRSTGPHLHFSVYSNQKPVDPSKLLSGDF